VAAVPNGHKWTPPPTIPIKKNMFVGGVSNIGTVHKFGDVGKRL
jgi:hypothetical protein